MELGLHDRVVLITGASLGIGKAGALVFGGKGTRVAVTYRNQRDKAQAVVAEIERAGGEGLATFLDFAAPDSIHAAVHSAVERWGRLDVLSNNAVQLGMGTPGDVVPFEEVPADEWTSPLRATIEGPYVAIQAALPAMRAQRWGRIVNVSTGIAVDGLPGAGPYAAARATAHGLTRRPFKELGYEVILVNVVMPGLTLTERNVALIPARKSASVRRRFAPSAGCRLRRRSCRRWSFCAPPRMRRSPERSCARVGYHLILEGARATDLHGRPNITVSG